MIDLNKKHIEEIKTIIAKYMLSSSYKVYIFGSRVKGIAKETSDVDICIVANEDIRFRLDNISSEFRRSTFPYAVDIVDYKSASTIFKENIDMCKIEI